MEKAKLQELRAAAQANVEKELMSLREEQFKLRMQKGTGQLANFARMKTVRRDIARLETLLREKTNALKGK